MRKSVLGERATRRARGRRGLSLALMFGGLWVGACGVSARQFGNPLESGGTAGTTTANAPSLGGAQSSLASAGHGSLLESGANSTSDAGAAGEASELVAGGSAETGAGSAGTSSSGGSFASTGSAGTSSAGSSNAGPSSSAGASGAGASGAGVGGGGVSGAGASVGGGGVSGARAGGAGAGAGGTSANAAGAGGTTSVLPPSCAGLEPSCGAQATTNCCSAHPVSGGDFNRLNNTTPSYAATVSDFILDDYEITVGRFRKFVTAYNSTGKKPPALGAGKNPHDASDAGWLESYNASLVSDLPAQVSCGLPFQTWTDELGANENRPINCLSWYTAQAFCIWDGGRLPTLAEWSYAAVGGAQQRYYPWSSPPNDTTISASNASYDCLGDGTSGCALTDLVRVGAKKDGVGRFLQSDLSGNVSEWVIDWYGDAPPSPCTDCANFTPGTGKFRHFMGGSFEKNAFNQQTSGTSSTQPSNTMYTTGARCARN